MKMTPPFQFWRKQLPIVPLIVLLSSIGSLRAEVWPMWNTWMPIGDTLLVDAIGNLDGGDGANEVMLLVDGQSQATGQGVAYAFQGTLSANEIVEIEIYLKNPGSEECRLMIDFYNASDSRVIATAPETTLQSGASLKTSLSMTATAADLNDLLQLRLIRSDDGSASRDFGIDSVVMDGWYFPRTSHSPVSIDLPLLPFEQGLQDEMNQIVDNWYTDQLPAPTRTRVDRAEADYAALSIRYENGQITGDLTAYNQTNRLDALAAALFTGNIGSESGSITQEEADRWKGMVNEIVKLYAQNTLNGRLDLDIRGYDVRAFIRDAILLRGFLDEDARDSLTYVLYRNTDKFDTYWRSDYPGSVELDTVDTDQIYNFSDTLLIYGLAFQDSPEEAQRWARGLKRYCERFATPSRGTSNGIKIDGTGYHHWNHYPRYLYAYRTFIEVLDALGTSQLQIDQEHYRIFRDAAISLFVQSRERVLPLSLIGRDPNSNTIPMDQENLLQMAIAGGRILGLATADPEVAAVYNAVFGLDASLGVDDINTLEGAFQFNLGNMGVYRKDNWTAIMRGFTSSHWGAEIYPTSNRYGRYQAYGALELLYYGGEIGGNGILRDGWNWNHAPGSTSIVLPWEQLHGERARIDEQQQESFAGSSTLNNMGSPLLSQIHGRYGIFGMKFQELENQGFSTVFGSNTHNDSFVFRKSVFAFDDIIVALGSDIANDDQAHNTVTTLSQRAVSDEQPIFVNGESYTGQIQASFSRESSHWVVDHFQTGYYVPPSNESLILARGSQTSPLHTSTDPSDTSQHRTGDFARLYLDHGTSPTGSEYEFVTIPDTTLQEMQAFETLMTGPAESRPYQVVVKDNQSHVVRYQGDGKDVWSLALFEDVSELPESCLVQSNTGASLVMYERLSQSEIVLSISDPDLGLESRSYAPTQPSNAQLVLRGGNWMISTPHEKATSEALSDQTLLTFELQDGLPVEIRLVIDGYRRWMEEQFDENEQANPFVSGPHADPDEDRIKNLMEYVLGQNPHDWDAYSIQIFQSNSGTDLHFILADEFPGYALTIEKSINLIDWTPTGTFNGDGGGAFTIVNDDITIEETSAPRGVNVRVLNQAEQIFFRLSAQSNGTSSVSGLE